VSVSPLNSFPFPSLFTNQLIVRIPTERPDSSKPYWQCPETGDADVGDDCDHERVVRAGMSGGGGLSPSSEWVFNSDKVESVSLWRKMVAFGIFDITVSHLPGDGDEGSYIRKSATPLGPLDHI
jgi:hypothetical protein